MSQDDVLLRIVVLLRLGILRMVYRRVASDLNWLFIIDGSWVTWVMGQNLDRSHESGSNYIDPLSALIYNNYIDNYIILNNLISH